VYLICLQNNDVELLAGYLSLHQDGDQLSVKWTPNQLMNGCSEDAEESLPTKKYETRQPRFTVVGIIYGFSRFMHCDNIRQCFAMNICLIALHV